MHTIPSVYGSNRRASAAQSQCMLHPHTSREGASNVVKVLRTVQYKPATSLAGNNNALAYYGQSRGYDQISHALSNIHGLYVWSCNLLDVISV